MRFRSLCDIWGGWSGAGTPPVSHCIPINATLQHLAYYLQPQLSLPRLGAHLIVLELLYKIGLVAVSGAAVRQRWPSLALPLVGV